MCIRDRLDYLKNTINNTGDVASIMLAGQQEVVVKKNNVVKDESTYLTVMEAVSYTHLCLKILVLWFILIEKIN